MEKQNKTMRQKRKKDEMARIRTLVGTVFTINPSCTNLITQLHLYVVYRQRLQLRPPSEVLQGTREGRESGKEEGKEGSSQEGGSGEREGKVSILWW